VLLSRDLNEPRESTECRSGLSEFYTVTGTDTEKARDANMEATAGFENRWADDDLSCPVVR